MRTLEVENHDIEERERSLLSNIRLRGLLFKDFWLSGKRRFFKCFSALENDPEIFH